MSGADPASAVAELSIYDYMGIPVGTVFDSVPFSSLPFRCYNKIYNFWFRDENLVPAAQENTGDGPDGENNYKLLKRRKRRDYLTSGLPWPQKGPAVTIDLAGNAPVYGIGVLTTEVAAAGGAGLYKETANRPSDRDWETRRFRRLSSM